MADTDTSRRIYSRAEETELLRFWTAAIAWKQRVLNRVMHPPGFAGAKEALVAARTIWATFLATPHALVRSHCDVQTLATLRSAFAADSAGAAPVAVSPTLLDAVLESVSAPVLRVLALRDEAAPSCALCSTTLTALHDVTLLQGKYYHHRCLACYKCRTALVRVPFALTPEGPCCAKCPEAAPSSSSAGASSLSSASSSASTSTSEGASVVAASPDRRQRLQKVVRSADLSQLVAGRATRPITVYFSAELKRTVIVGREATLGDAITKACAEKGFNPALRELTMPDGSAVEATTPVEALSGSEVNLFVRSKKLSAEESALRMAEQRRHVSEELLSSEESYVAALRAVEESFIGPLRSDADTFEADAILPPAHIEGIFGNWSELLALHAAFLAMLRPHVAPWPGDAQAGIGAVCLGLVASSSPYALLKPYERYMANFEASRALVAHHDQAGSRFREFCTMAKSAEQVQHDLPGYLIMPIQRIPRYIMLVKDILANTPETHADHKSLTKLDRKLRALADAVNSTKSAAVLEVAPSEASQAPKEIKEGKEGALSFNESFPTLRQSERVFSELPCLYNAARGTLWLTQRYLCFASKQDKLFLKFSDISDIKLKGKGMRVTAKDVHKFTEVPDFADSFGLVYEQWAKARPSDAKLKGHKHSHSDLTIASLTLATPKINPRSQRPASARDFERALLDMKNKNQSMKPEHRHTLDPALALDTSDDLDGSGTGAPGNKKLSTQSQPALHHRRQTSHGVLSQSETVESPKRKVRVSGKSKTAQSSPQFSPESSESLAAPVVALTPPPAEDD